jgi:hypothetical protein
VDVSAWRQHVSTTDDGLPDRPRDWRYYGDRRDPEAPHRCDEERCVCPVHGTPMYWWPKGGLHACQDRDCEHARGVDLDKLFVERMHEQRAVQRRHEQAWNEFWHSLQAGGFSGDFMDYPPPPPGPMPLIELPFRRKT